MSYIPQPGDVNVQGIIVTALQGGGGIVLADAVQGVAGTQWAGKSNRNKNPLLFEFSGSVVVHGVQVYPSPNTRVKFDIVQAGVGSGAQNVRLL